MRLIEAYRSVRSSLERAQDAEAGADARYIVSGVAGVGLTDIFVHAKSEIDAGLYAKMKEAASRVIGGEPVQYALGSAWFCGREFYVDKRVLIPRPETELLAERACSALKRGMRALDICTGSGAVAVTLALNTGAEVWAGDISAKALEVARENAKRHKAAVAFYEGDLFCGAVGRFDVITANPPYVAADEYALLPGKIKNFEPRQALYAGEDGLEALRRIAALAGGYLKPGGEIYLEIGYSQSERVRALLSGAGFGAIRSVKDYSGIERIIIAQVNHD